MFSGQQRFETHPRNLGRGLRDCDAARRGAGYVSKFRFRWAGAQRAHANSVTLRFFGDRFGEEKIKGFRRGVRGDVGHRLERRSRGNDQNIAAAPLNHGWQVQMREVHHGEAVHFHHVQLGRGIAGVEFAICAEAGVVDEKVDLDSARLREGVNCGGRGGVREIGRSDFYFDVVLRGQALAQIFQAIGTARGDDEISSASGEFFGQRLADARACAGDERPLISPCVHQVIMIAPSQPLPLRAPAPRDSRPSDAAARQR